MSDPHASAGTSAGTSASTEWLAVLDRVSGLVRDTVAADGERAMALHVPACPDWTARDLLAHVVGLVADVLDGDEPDDHHEAWTRAQVEARRGRSSLELLAEWEEHAPAMARYLDEVDTRPLGDAVIHEQDLRGALDRPGARETAGLAMVRASMAARLAEAVAGLAPVELRSPSWSWRSHGEPDAEAGAQADARADAQAGVVLEASGFDLARSLTSRRTADQLASYAVTGDVGPYLEAFAQLGPLPDNPLPE